MAIFNSFLYVYQAGYTCRDLAEDDQVDGVQDPWWLIIIRDCTNQYVGGILTIHCHWQHRLMSLAEACSDLLCKK